MTRKRTSLPGSPPFRSLAHALHTYVVMLKMSHVLGAFAVFGTAAAAPATAAAREISALVGPAMRVAAGMNESGSLLLLGSVLAGLAYIIDGRQGRS